MATAAETAAAASNAAGIVGIEGLLGAAAILFVVLLVVAAVSEQVIEMLRGMFPGVFAILGVPDLKSRVTLDEAQKLAAEFLPAGGPALARANALVTLGKNYPEELKAMKARIDAAADQVKTALGPDFSGMLTGAASDALGQLTVEVKAALDNSERVRVAVLRTLSFGICLLICVFGQVSAFAMVAEAAPGIGAGFAWAIPKNGSWAPFWGELLTAFAASSGSSYWHDQLDRVRALKSLAGTVRDVTAQV